MDQAVALDGRAVDSSCLDYDCNRAGTDSNDLSCDFVDIRGLANLDAAAYWERAVSQNPKQERRKNVPKTTGENEEGTGVLGNEKKGRANLSNREREEQRT